MRYTTLLLLVIVTHSICAQSETELIKLDDDTYFSYQEPDEDAEMAIFEVTTINGIIGRFTGRKVGNTFYGFFPEGMRPFKVVDGKALYGGYEITKATFLYAYNEQPSRQERAP